MMMMMMMMMTRPSKDESTSSLIGENGDGEEDMELVLAASKSLSQSIGNNSILTV